MQFAAASILFVSLATSMSTVPPKVSDTGTIAPSAATQTEPQAQVVPVTCNPSIQRCH